MRVFHLPTNYASQVSILVRALNDIGVEARGLVSEHKFTPLDSNVKPFELITSYKQQPIKTIRLCMEVEAAIRWADVIHWHGVFEILPKSFDLKYTVLLKKARIVSFWGSNIRIPDITIKDNPYLKKFLANSKDSYPISYSSSRIRQEKFAKYGFECTFPSPELEVCIQRDLFPRPFRLDASLTIEEFKPHFPDPTRKKLLVVHLPTNSLLKGTNDVLKTISQLKCDFDFDFKLIENMSRSEALSFVRECDIVLDQFMVGSYGTVSLEAMAFGKPTVCYLKPSVIEGLSEDCPIVNANVDNLKTVLAGLFTNGTFRYNLGVKGRAYVEKYHDSHKMAEQLKTIYLDMLNNKN